MHFDFPGVSDCYFIDPHWLYGVFCQVCKSPMFHYSSRIDSKLLQSIFNSITRVTMTAIMYVYQESRHHAYIDRRKEIVIFMLPWPFSKAYHFCNIAVCHVR